MYDKCYPSVFVDEFLNPEKVTEISYLCILQSVLVRMIS